VALADAGLPEEMLKLVSVLVADVVGSTARAERMHPEDTRTLMADYFAAVAAETRQRAARSRSSSAMRQKSRLPRD